jgi:hypothetical protein
MSPDQRPVVAEKHRRVTVMLRLDQQDGSGLQVAQEHAPFYLRLHNIVIHLIAQVSVGPEHLDLQVRVHEGYQPIDVCIIHP